MFTGLPKQVRYSIALVGLALFSASPFALADDLIFNGTAESGTAGWALFMGKQEEGKGAAFEAVKTDSHSGEQCLKMVSKEEARYTIAPRLTGKKVVPGDRCRFTTWVRAGEDFTQKPQTTGFYVRGTCFAAPGKDLPGGHYFFALPDTTMRGYALNLLGSAPIPKVWTKLTSVFEIPEGMNILVIGFTVERASGSLYIDDASLEIVGPEVPLSKVIKDSSEK